MTGKVADYRIHNPRVLRKATCFKAPFGFPFPFPIRECHLQPTDHPDTLSAGR